MIGGAEFNMMGVTLTEQIQAIPVSSPHYANELWVVGVLVSTFILGAVFSDRKHYYIRLLRDFFLPRERAVEGARTTTIAYMRMGMYLVGLSSVSLLVAIAFEDSSIMVGQAYLWLLIGGVVLLCYLVKVLIFAATNRIFFDHSTVALWEYSYAAWTILASVPLYLLCVCVLFFNIPPRFIFLLLGIGVVVLEICLLYKAFHIFSSKKYGILQIFVYLCTLELMPLLVVGKALVLFV